MKIGITERGDAALDYNEVLRSSCSVRPDGIILISKNPVLLLEKLSDIEPPVPFIIHATITGFGGEAIEPNIPPAEEALKAYHELVDRYGTAKVILRVDPIFLLGRAMPIVREAEGRVRISFADGYDHVRKRFKDKAPEYIPLLPSRFHIPLDKRQEMLEAINKELGYEAEVCGEPNMECSGCVSEKDLETMGLSLPKKKGKSFQRKACTCMGIKTELLSRRGQCPHGCLYCYWK